MKEAISDVVASIFSAPGHTAVGDDRVSVEYIPAGESVLSDL